MKIKKSGILLIGVLGSLLFGTNVYAESYASVNVDALNIRQSPSEAAAIVEVYSKKDTVKIINQADQNWYAVENKNGKTAYVSAEYVDVFKVKAKINTNGVNSRTYPTTDAKINRQFNNGQEISVHYKVGDWYYISLGTEVFWGFVHHSYIDSEFLYLVAEKNISDVKEIEIKAPEKAKAPQETKASTVVEYAKKFIGNPYRYGGTSLTKGTDCSGFTQQIMKKAGVSLQRSSAGQYARNGVKVSINNLQPGDLLFYGYGGKVSHVGVYIGNKKMINASSSKTGIIISNAFRTSGKPLIGAKRVI
ncbi:MAG TPA: SH3 domain-containing protein [Epulopiscium sp.]|nr:SH3 domain-containing protein [Candidatus Epulonipiscium sp.]